MDSTAAAAPIRARDQPHPTSYIALHLAHDSLRFQVVYRVLLEHMVAVLSLDDQMDAGDSMDLEGYRVAEAVVHPANLVLEAFLEVEVRIVDSNIAGLPAPI